MKTFLCAALAAGMVLGSTPLVHAMPYQIDVSNSRIGFSGVHADTPFSGTFTNWQAAVVFDPANLPESRLSATFMLNSAVTGNPQYDLTLPTADWFNVAQHPTASFASQRLEAGTVSNTYVAHGTLNIRGVALPAVLPFTLTQLPTGATRAQGTLALDRLAYNIGRQSDADGTWVSRIISVTVDVTGYPRP